MSCGTFRSCTHSLTSYELSTLKRLDLAANHIGCALLGTLSVAAAYANAIQKVALHQRKIIPINDNWGELLSKQLKFGRSHLKNDAELCRRVTRQSFKAPTMNSTRRTVLRCGINVKISLRTRNGCSSFTKRSGNDLSIDEAVKVDVQRFVD